MVNTRSDWSLDLWAGELFSYFSIQAFEYFFQIQNISVIGKNILQNKVYIIGESEIEVYNNYEGVSERL